MVVFVNDELQDKAHTCKYGIHMTGPMKFTIMGQIQVWIMSIKFAVGASFSNILHLLKKALARFQYIVSS